MIRNNQWRNPFLATICSGMCLITVYSFIEPSAGNRQVASFTFPEYVPLNSWKLEKTKSLNQKKEEINIHEDLVESSKSYVYSQNGIPLKIEMRYLVGTRGDVNNLIKEKTTIPAEVLKKIKEEHLENIGFYTQFTYKDRAYLSACINPRGNSTFTQKQFSKNLYLHDFNWNILIDWLQGKASIRDRRCLWTNLSIPVDPLKPEKTYQILQQAWSSWYQWWQPRFPSL
jgi:cyanosortase A-associated protein